MAELQNEKQAQNEQFLQTLENFVRRYLRVRDTIKELNKEKKGLGRRDNTNG